MEDFGHLFVYCRITKERKCLYPLIINEWRGDAVIISGVTSFCYFPVILVFITNGFHAEF